MNIATSAHSLYGQSPSLKTPRDLEYDIFARITGRLKTALVEPAPGQDRTCLTPALVAALHDNRRLWTTLAMDLAHPENGFPADLRARLFYLAEFTLHSTDQILAGRASAAILVEVNTAIMRGLRGEVPS